MTERELFDSIAADASAVVEGGTLHAGLHVRLAFYDATAIVKLDPNLKDPREDHVVVDATLPRGAGRARLRHQGKLSVVAQLREQKLGDDVVDAAFIVSCDDDGFALLTQCLPQLRALVAGGVDDDVEVELGEAALSLRWSLAGAPPFLALWERLVNLRVAQGER